MQWSSAPIIGEAPLPQRARSFWGTRLIRAWEALEERLERERAQLPPWILVGLIAGIALWFDLNGETQWVGCLFGCVGTALFGLAIPGRSGRALTWFAGAAAVGMALIWWRSADVAAPRLERPVVAQFSGRVEQADTIAARDQVRLLIATASAGLPRRVRVTINSADAPIGLDEGAQVKLRARLAPPPSMALPGTYDFARDAWFQQIGAVGKALGPVSVLSAGHPQGFLSAREDLRKHIEDNLPLRTRGIAVALATGDQNAVEQVDVDAMRRSGLTHLLSVSGLHIAAVVSFALIFTIRLLALSPFLALRLNLVLVGALVAAVAGIGYTLLTGAQVPTVRSCVAAVLVLAGLAMGRDAMSMRLVAAGALLVILFRPEAIAGPSFQMSFGAVAAIIALHSTAWARQQFGRKEESIVRRVGRELLSLVVTGLAVEVALIPIALFHFHRTGLYGVGANIIAIPMTTFLIMPLEALSLLFGTIGLRWPFWRLTDWSIAALLDLAQWVGTSAGAVATMPDFPRSAMGMMAIGGLWLILWQTRWRRLGLIPIVAGMTIALLSPRPDVLVTGDGRHVAVIVNGKPFVLRDRSGDYVRALLSEAAGFDGDGDYLSAAPFGRCSADACLADIAKEGARYRLLAIRSRHFLNWDEMIDACDRADVVVAERRLPDACRPRWLKLDGAALRRSGGVAISLGQSPSIRTVAEAIGNHPWRQDGIGEKSPATRTGRPESAGVPTGSARRQRSGDRAAAFTRSGGNQ